MARYCGTAAAGDAGCCATGANRFLSSVYDFTGVGDVGEFLYWLFHLHFHCDCILLHLYLYGNGVQAVFDSQRKNAGSNYSRLGDQQCSAAANILRLTEHLQHPQYISAAFHIL